MSAEQFVAENASGKSGLEELQGGTGQPQPTTGEPKARLLEKGDHEEKLVRRDAEISYLKNLVQKQAEIIDTLRHRPSWRFALPFRRFRAWMEIHLFKNELHPLRDADATKRISFEFVAQNDLDRDISLSGHWHSTGEDPHFFLHPYRRKSFRNWYMIELSISGSIPQGTARFYFDSGDGFSEEQSIVLPYRNGQMAKRLYRFDHPPVNIRFDPLEVEGVFCIEHLHFAKVPSWFAVKRMIKKIRTTHNDYLNKNENEIRTLLKQQAQTEGLPFVDVVCGVYAQYFKTASKNYGEWIQTIEKPLFEDRHRIRMNIEAFEQMPLISVVVPVYNTDVAFLRRCIESVINQSYEHWELCIADDASTEAELAGILEGYAEADQRIKIVFRKENGHISEASNSALELATGEFVALLDHDDELSEHALYFAAKAINENVNASILYSDEDKIDADGIRTDPHFKSRWNPDLFLSQNYMSHLSVLKRELVQTTGGFRRGVEGSQDYDLLLRCLSRSTDAEIVHIPYVLYHWRVAEGSTAQDAGEKGYTTAAGIEALKHFVRQKKFDVVVEAGLVPNTYRMTYPVPDPAPLVTLLIPTRDEVEVLSRCISSLVEKTTYANYEILILDNQSRDPKALDYLASMNQRETIRVVPYDRSFNFSAINNFGVEQAHGEMIAFVNNDVEVISPHWLTEMVSHAIRPGRGCVGAKLYYPDGRIQHAGVILGIGGVAGHSHKYFQKSSYGYFSRLLLVQNVSAVTAACLVVRKKIFDEVGGFDQENLAIAFNDVDFCLKVQQAGYKNVWTPYAELIHHESVSRGGEDSTEKIERFNRETRFMKAKWKEILADDPYYSPHLSRIKEDFSIG